MKTPHEEARDTLFGALEKSNWRECRTGYILSRITTAIANARADGMHAGIAAERAQQKGTPDALATIAAVRALGIKPQDFTSRAKVVLLLLLFLLAPLTARAADPVPFFKPDPRPHHTPKPYGPPRPHPVATECAINDKVCLREHDDRALTLAVEARDKSWCTQAVRVNACMLLYEFVFDDGPPPKATNTPLLRDPCTFVVRLDNGAATLYSFRARRWFVAPDEGWEPAEFLGTCDIDKLPPLAADGVQVLPGFPWGKR